MMSLSLSAGVRPEDFEVDGGFACFLAAALTGRTPPERLLDEFDIVVELIHEWNNDMNRVY